MIKEVGTVMHRFVHTVGQQEWLEPIGDQLQSLVQKAFDGIENSQQVQNVLNGVGLSHPLHVIVKDVPLGAWTAAAALDALEVVTGEESLGAGADAAVAVGLAGSSVASSTGLTDWQHLQGHPRRIGVGHALMNLTAGGLYATSLLARRRDQRGLGRLLGWLGFGVLALGAYLGGHMVFKQRVGVDHTAGKTLPSEYVAVLPESELAEGQLRRVQVDDVPVLLVRRGDRVEALLETCAHLGGPLADGELDDGCVVCPWHGSRFALEDGQVVDGPSVYDQPALDVRIREGQVEVRKATHAT